MDIAILADTSRSMNKDQLKKLTQLVGKLIDETGVSPKGSHYGFVTFNREVKVHTTFSNSKYYNKEDLKALISEIQESRDVDWGTRSDIALSEATKLFTATEGDRPDAKNFVFVFTDGKFKITPKDRKPYIPFEDSTKALEEENVKITIIAILGGNCKKSKTALQACKDEMNKMAGEQGEVLMFKDFDDLIKRYQEVSDSLCPVDGNYTDWTISECSVTCGGGVKTITRTCTNPPPSNGGKNCDDLGPAEKTEQCNEQECPVDGNYTDWTISECSVTCGGGLKTFIRACTNPPPSNGGKNCDDLGPAIKTEQCNGQECPVDGSYTDWTISECSVTCGGGVKTFTRTCTNPPPSNGGKNCDDLGPAEKTEQCNEHKCPPPCTAGLDIGIVLDKSRSVKNTNLVKVLKFLKDLIKKFNPAPDADHFGFITFNKNAKVVFDFSNPKYHKKKDLLNKIESEPIKLELQTRTDLALKLADEKLFTAAGGDRPDKPNVMLVLTDGRPTCPRKKKKGKGKFDFNDFADNIAKDLKEADTLLNEVAMLDRQTRSELALIKRKDDAEKRKNKKNRKSKNRNQNKNCDFGVYVNDLKKKNVYIVAVGIGRNIKQDILQSIAGEDGQGKVVQVENFDVLEGLINNIKSAACSD